jgi:hypothetical protein
MPLPCVFFNLPLTDKVSPVAIYNGKTTDLPDGDAANVWKNMFKLFHAKNINKTNELKSELVKSTLQSAETNPDEWFDELNFIRWCLEEDYKCITCGDVEMMNQIIYSRKPSAYQMQLTVIKDLLIKEDARILNDAAYV